MSHLYSNTYGCFTTEQYILQYNVQPWTEVRCPGTCLNKQNVCDHHADRKEDVKSATWASQYFDMMHTTVMFWTCTTVGHLFLFYYYYQNVSNTKDKGTFSIDFIIVFFLLNLTGMHNALNVMAFFVLNTLRS